LRGEKEEILDLTMNPGDTEPAGEQLGDFESQIARHFDISPGSGPAGRWLAATVRGGWRTPILVPPRAALRGRPWHAAAGGPGPRAGGGAVGVFGANVRDLLLAAPAGTRRVLGLDPGFRTGVKVAVVDATGKVVATETISPHEPHRRWQESLAVLARLAAA